MQDSTTTIAEYRKIYDDFLRSRKWRNENPHELILSMFIELGELSEFFQWNDEASQKRRETPESKQKIAFEAVDIFHYLIAFCNLMNIDLAAVGEEKFKKLAEKYPAGIGGMNGEDYWEQKEKFRKLGKN